MCDTQPVRRLLVVVLVMVLAGCGGDDPEVTRETVATTTTVSMGTLRLVTGDGRSVTFDELIEERGLVPMPSEYGTLWYEASTGGGFMAGDCHGVTPELIDPDGDTVQAVACYGADGQDEVNTRAQVD